MRDAIFLFDVDGTLLQAGSRYHNQSLLAAVEQVRGKPPHAEALALAGRTDTEILLDMVASTGVESTPDLLPRLFEASVLDFDARCPADISDLVIPGVRPTLEALAGEGAAVGLVTGNIQAIAWRKMVAAGLRQFFGFGAFGDESGRRAELPPLAVSRAGRSFEPAHSYVIGDTPLDIDCGLACGMKTVAVATGRYSLDELRACQPSLACANLTDFLEALWAGHI
ncbi:MAG TPA: HAD hydrolase-like protein [Chloroflexota bacterium]